MWVSGWGRTVVERVVIIPDAALEGKAAGIAEQEVILDIAREPGDAGVVLSLDYARDAGDTGGIGKGVAGGVLVLPLVELIVDHGNRVDQDPASHVL